MKPVELLVFGGCHVAGYPIGSAQAFPTMLSELLGGRVVAQVPYLTVTHLPEHLLLIDRLRPSHVVLQLGNHEFSDSFRPLLRQVGGLLFSRQLASTKPTKPKLAAPATPAASAGPAGTLRHWARAAGLCLLTSLLWLLLRPHRRTFRALNACIRRHPQTTFVFLSPFPSLSPTQNILRHFGGWLLRQQVVASPNRQWLDSHRLLRADQKLFVDATHLNKYAHQALAYGLAAAVSSNID